MAKLPKFGFDPNHFVGAVTSEEESSKYIRSTYAKSNKEVKRALWFTWDGQGNMPRPHDYLAKCGNVEDATCVEEADFVLAHGWGPCLAMRRRASIFGVFFDGW